MPIRPLLYTMAVPLMLSLLVQSLYNWMLCFPEKSVIPTTYWISDTASKVIHGKTEKISDKTVKRVLQKHHLILLHYNFCSCQQQLIDLADHVLTTSSTFQKTQIQLHIIWLTFSYFCTLFFSPKLSRLFCNALINSSITIGLDKNPSIPHSSLSFCPR